MTFLGLSTFLLCRPAHDFPISSLSTCLVLSTFILFLTVRVWLHLSFLDPIWSIDLSPYLVRVSCYISSLTCPDQHDWHRLGSRKPTWSCSQPKLWRCNIQNIILNDFHLPEATVISCLAIQVTRLLQNNMREVGLGDARALYTSAFNN